MGTWASLSFCLALSLQYMDLGIHKHIYTSINRHRTHKPAHLCVDVKGAHTASTHKYMHVST
jgi:hypothetical protein